MTQTFFCESEIFSGDLNCIVDHDKHCIWTNFIFGSLIIQYLFDVFLYRISIVRFNMSIFYPIYRPRWHTFFHLVQRHLLEGPAIETMAAIGYFLGEQPITFSNTNFSGNLKQTAKSLQTKIHLKTKYLQPIVDSYIFKVRLNVSEVYNVMI